MKRSVVLDRLAECHKEKIEEYVFDRDGHWIFLNLGWIQQDMETGTIHEPTVKGTLEYFRNIELGVVFKGNLYPNRGFIPENDWREIMNQIPKNCYVEVIGKEERQDILVERIFICKRASNKPYMEFIPGEGLRFLPVKIAYKKNVK